MPIRNALCVRIEIAVGGDDITTSDPRIECEIVLATLRRCIVLQAITNVVGNAIKFTPTGGAIEIQGRGDGDAYTFIVSDTGPGIAIELVARVFEPFAHGASRGEDAAGLGLGLFIAHGIALAHGGRIWVERTGTTGTTLCLTLPA